MILEHHPWIKLYELDRVKPQIAITVKVNSMHCEEY
jgi:hypothetical protein